MKEMLVKSCDLPMSDQMTNIDNRLTSWMGDAEQVDDVLIMGLRC